MFTHHVTSKKGPRKRFVKDLSTCRRHLEKEHEVRSSSIFSNSHFLLLQLWFQAAYNKWAKEKNFESMLPKAIAKRRSDMIEKSSLNQSVLDGHLCERPTTERVMPYSDQLFREVATEWLILTDQVC